jgi:two-component system chemotaxis response regulator CheY
MERVLTGCQAPAGRDHPFPGSHASRFAGRHPPQRQTTTNRIAHSLSGTDFQKALLLLPDPVRRHGLRRVLSRLGVSQVLEAETAHEALTLLGGELVDLVLTVWQAPDLGGTELLAALRNRGLNRNVPVVLLDDGIPQPLIVAGVKAGIAGRLNLPGSPERLAEILATIRESRHRLVAGG